MASAGNAAGAASSHARGARAPRRASAIASAAPPCPSRCVQTCIRRLLRDSETDPAASARAATRTASCAAPPVCTPPPIRARTNSRGVGLGLSIGSDGRIALLAQIVPKFFVLPRRPPRLAPTHNARCTRRAYREIYWSRPLGAAVRVARTCLAPCVVSAHSAADAPSPYRSCPAHTCRVHGPVPRWAAYATVMIALAAWSISC